MNVTTLITPLAEKMAVREVAAHTFLTVEEIAEVFGMSEVTARIWITATPVLVNIFWHGEEGKEKGEILVTTPKGEEILGRFLCWREFWNAEIAQNWIYEGGYGYLNAPNLPDLNNDVRGIYSGNRLF